MAISDDERRDVARKLREIERQTLCELTDGELIDFLVETVGFNRYTNEDFDEGLLGRIADLIDRPSTTRHGKFRTKYGRETPCCEVCGYSIGDMRWGYCPKCGAEVVS
ncbi:hypothetical protein [Ellagibacter isourolithinifaciens]|uniref:hypothetical protein n=1 Tax=Ellagibacter isourolithinifaciens TaxID=2137581 RepID=UPI003A8D8509